MDAEKNTMQPEKRVEYIELFFDLIFVYTFRSINGLFHGMESGFPSAELLGSFFFLMAVAVQVWFFSVLFFNRYGRKSIRDYLTILLNMYLLYYMATSGAAHLMQNYARYHLAWAGILLNLAYRNWDKREYGHHLDELDRQILYYTFQGLCMQALLVLLCIPVYRLSGLPLSALALLFGFVIRYRNHHFLTQHPADFPHLTERILLLVILTFGEMLIGIGSYFHPGGSIYYNLSAFLIATGMFLSYGFYYDNVLDHHKKTSGLGMLLLHVPLIIVINSTTIALEFFAREGMHSTLRPVFLLVMMILYYGLLLGINHYGKPIGFLNERYLILLLLLLAFYIPGIILSADEPRFSTLFTLLYVYLHLGLQLWQYKRKTGKPLHIGRYLE